MNTEANVTKKIAFDGKEIIVEGCYPYVESSQTGKVVLVISADESEGVTEADLHALVENESGIIEYFEKPEGGSFELKNTYTDYNSGEIRTSYANGRYEARVTRLGKFEKQQLQNAADIAFVAAMTGVDL